MLCVLHKYASRPTVPPPSREGPLLSSGFHACWANGSSRETLVRKGMEGRGSIALGSSSSLAGLTVQSSSAPGHSSFPKATPGQASRGQHFRLGLVLGAPPSLNPTNPLRD